MFANLRELLEHSLTVGFELLSPAKGFQDRSVLPDPFCSSRRQQPAIRGGPPLRLRGVPLPLTSAPLNQPSVLRLASIRERHSHDVLVGDLRIFRPREGFRKQLMALHCNLFCVDRLGVPTKNRQSIDNQLPIGLLLCHNSPSSTKRWFTRQVFRSVRCDDVLDSDAVPHTRY